MGCDIHVHLERKVTIPSRGIDCWQTVNQFTGIPVEGMLNVPPELSKENYGPAHMWSKVEDRNYDLFASLAGVRGEGPHPKGIPDDIAPLTAGWIDSWGGDAHSHSWEYADVFVEKYMEHSLPKEVIAQIAELRMNSEITSVWEYVLDRFIHCMPTNIESPDRWRFIFFFDN